jgi:hypothetical protein
LTPSIDVRPIHVIWSTDGLTDAFSAPSLTKHDSRIWRAQSLLVGSDCSWGVADEVTRALTLGPLDVEESPEVDVEAPLHIRCVRACVRACVRRQLTGPLFLFGRWGGMYIIVCPASTPPAHHHKPALQPAARRG